MYYSISKKRKKERKNKNENIDSKLEFFVK